MKQILSSFNDRLIPFMHDPKRLHAFLTETYNVGGALSILALESLFTLISKFNLDYPEFYQKLYVLFDRNVLHLKQCPRFLKLANLFLTSSHLPSYLVAAFVKKMARLALFAPPAATLAVLPIMHNLMQRHSSCLPLLHRGLDQVKNAETIEAKEAVDPFLFDEENPLNSRAQESSLWEMEALKDHYYSAVAVFVRDFQKPITEKKMPYKLDDFLGATSLTVSEF